MPLKVLTEVQLVPGVHIAVVASNPLPTPQAPGLLPHTCPQTVLLSKLYSIDVIMRSMQQQVCAVTAVRTRHGSVHLEHTSAMRAVRKYLASGPETNQTQQMKRRQDGI